MLLIMAEWAIHVFATVKVVGSSRLTIPVFVAAQMYLLRFIIE